MLFAGKPNAWGSASAASRWPFSAVGPACPPRQLDLSRWIGEAVPDGLSTEQALAELRGRPVPWQGEAADAKPSTALRRPARPQKAPRK